MSTLQEELQLEADYLALELERVSFSYSINVASEISPAMIDFPPLLLQPILENSIRHAFNSELTSPTININVFDRENTLQIEITDNGCKSWDSITASEGHGLSLIRKRIAIYNQRLENMPIQMKTNFREGTGTITIFTFQNWLV
ncbi:ATP-binding protein [Pedobacter borealis]|uniref:ATP-binding protein n=1 Tax=Pedobacter borealis TaxID=475254 RepID=UPI0004931156|nr:ATP-binding protein [Pedobacter borealis]